LRSHVKEKSRILPIVSSNDTYKHFCLAHNTTKIYLDNSCRNENRQGAVKGAGMWGIYDELISAVPEDSVISACQLSLHWFLVRAEGVGVTMAPVENNGFKLDAGRISGRKTREIAEWVKSWNFAEAAVGLAAINSALNAPALVEQRFGISLGQMPGENAFTALIDEAKGKKVAVVGHFARLERLAEVCQLTILERRPVPGDLPDSACEYVLPEQDIVVMTATTLINKTMPRLLQLSRNAHVIVCGPSTPLMPLMYPHGVDLLAGLVVEDPDEVWRAVQEGGDLAIFSCGSRMVRIPAMKAATQLAN
jgi:uncharacterized protein (DUF4213/DUF364 family)